MHNDTKHKTTARQTLRTLALLAQILGWIGVSTPVALANITQDARSVGHTLGSVAHKVGHKAKHAGIMIGHDAKKAGLAIGHAAKAGGLAFWHAAKGH
ncbi:MAG: hypothetical protein ACYDEV_07665 [Acidiferrobacter sp.]